MLLLQRNSVKNGQEDSILASDAATIPIPSIPPTPHMTAILNPPSIIPEPVTIPYSCDCKALLVGIGADEQLGGYGRHRTAFLRQESSTAVFSARMEKDNDAQEEDDLGAIGDDDMVARPQVESLDALVGMSRTDVSAGVEALELELNADLERLWKRNLGRYTATR